MIDNENKPLVSIFVATYNHEKFIHDCLDSILMQKTSFPYEIIVIDDASTDNNINIIKDYADRYPDVIRPFLLSENYFSNGKSKIFEKFFPNARGKYIAFCEGDDYWTFEYKLQNQVDFLETHQEYSMCCHNYSIKNESSSRITPKLSHIRYDSDITLNQILFEQIVQTSTVVARIDLIISDQYLRQDINNKIFHFTDIRFFLSYFNSGKIYGFKEYWSIYRIHDNGITSIDTTKRVISNHKILDNICNCYNGKYSYLKRRVKFHKHLDFWTLNRLDKKYAQAIMLLLKAFFMMPCEFINTYYHRYFVRLLDRYR